jgi:nucleotide-binding universal stress UspA family protein
MPTQALVGYDGSPAAGAAINAAGELFPQAHAYIGYLWTPPFTSDRLRRRLRAEARDVTQLIDLIEREGEREAETIAATGATLARAAGLTAEPLIKRSYAGEGLVLTQLAEQIHADVVVVGSRGLSGTDAVLGSVSDLAMHYASCPVLVVPHPLLTGEMAALSDGPVVVGYDGSAGAESACAATERLFPTREMLLVAVDHEGERVDSAAAAGRRVLALRADDRRLFGSHATSDALIACADEHDAAVLVVGSRGRSAAREILLGSVAMFTVHHSHRPVMVVHG